MDEISKGTNDQLKDLESISMFAGKILEDMESTIEEYKNIKNLQLLCTKPVIYIFNVDEFTLGDDARRAELADSNNHRPARSTEG